MQRTCGMLAALWLAGCVAYHAQPIDPAKTDAAFRARTLSDPGLVTYVRLHSSASATKPTTVSMAAPVEWDLRSLTLAALYYNRELAAARADLRAAQGAVRTAGAIPNPTLGVAPGHETEPGFPFLLDLSLDWPIETAGKRGYRIDQARAQALSARYQLAQAAWQVRSRVRTALVDYLMATRTVDAARTERDARRDVLQVLQQRFALGAVSRPDLDRARLDLNSAELGLRNAEGQESEFRAALATGVGVPLEAIEHVTVQWGDLEALPDSSAIPPLAVQRTALLDRADVRRALADYAATEAALQLEVAKQYPDIQLSPGYAFEEGVQMYRLGASLILPVLNQNQGPIAEAQARREAAAARFESLQADVIGQTQQAVARYRAALSVVREADRIVTLSQNLEQNVQSAFNAGRDDRLALADAQVQSAVSQAAQVDALHKAQIALGNLEDSMQRPIHSPALVAPRPTTSTTTSRSESHE